MAGSGLWLTPPISWVHVQRAPRKWGVSTTCVYASLATFSAATWVRSTLLEKVAGVNCVCFACSVLSMFLPCVYLRVYKVAQPLFMPQGGSHPPCVGKVAQPLFMPQRLSDIRCVGKSGPATFYAATSIMSTCVYLRRVCVSMCMCLHCV